MSEEKIPWRRFALSLEPRVRSRERGPDPRPDRSEDLRETAIEIVPGVRVALLSTGDQVVMDAQEPGGYVRMYGATIGVWDEREPEPKAGRYLIPGIDVPPALDDPLGGTGDFG